VVISLPIMSSLSLGLCCERLPASVFPIPDPPDQAGFDAQAELRNRINRFCERVLAEGKWLGTLVQATINSLPSHAI
jgi:hypothetical protein